MFKYPEMKFQCQIILKNHDKSDIRIYNMEVQVIPKPVKAIIEMKVPCGEELKYSILFYLVQLIILKR